ncbi:ATPase, T2SS/T4P/T4SS family [Roseateles sp.]|uniref:GspE/PulE family protein n=1 Tax=Roseateles sp. TaxID=1971397 RepID=UPI00326526BC
MTDPSEPLPWPQVEADASTAHASGFLWPTPPYAAYPQPQVQKGAEACEILGLNNSRSLGQLLAVDASDRIVRITVPPARNSMPLKFSQFRAVKLMRAIAVPPRDENDQNASLSLDQRPRSDFRIVFNGGDELKGVTIGHQHDKLGLFLFPPLSESDDSVRRVFIPREVLAHFEIGERIGDLLLKDQLVTQEQLAAAAVEQTGLRQRRVGDILVEQHIVSAEQLLQAIEQQAKMPMVRIGEALLALEFVTPEQLEVALVQQRDDRSVPLGELLVRKNVISRAQLQSALARKMGYPVVDVERFAIEPDAVRKLPYAVAKRLEMLPLVLRDGRLVVAMEDPTRREALDEVEFITQLKVVPTLTRLGTLQFAIPTTFERFGAEALPRANIDSLPDFQPDFSLDSSNKLIESLERDSSERSSKEDESPIEQSDNSLVRLINTMIIEAHNQGVSDIHIETYPGREKLKIRFRRDGVLQPYLELPPNYRNAMIARIKIMCDLDISERRKPQDGKINFARFSAQHRLELRVATIPTNNGLEDVVMRILASSRPMPLDRIGLTPANLAALRTAVARPYGMVLCVGPTGSGKTTTLHSALSHINTADRKIWTAEDPIEITQAGLRQVQVNPKIDWTFAKALRAFLRADPDVIMVGEIRDQETAEIAVEASLTGHLVLSTLHTNSAAETITRLLDMGMDPFNFADSLLAVLAQRLVRRCCTACQTSEPLTEAELSELLDDYLHAFPADARPNRLALTSDWIKNHGQSGRLMKFTNAGCATCGHSGYKGRAGLHELLTVSRDIRHMIQTGARAEELFNAALAEGMRSLRQDGIVKVLQGLTTIAEVHATSNA